MRGGDRYPVLVRKTEPKPIRIFMQDGSQDGLPGFLDEVGDWWLGNQAMQRALEFAGYQVQHAWGTGTHSGEHATAIFPDAMRWLWRDWPAPVTAGQSKNSFLAAIVPTEEAWHPVPDDDPMAARLVTGSRQQHAAGPHGRDYATDPASGQVWLTRATGTTVLLDSGLLGPTAVALSPDGLWLAVAESQTHAGYSYRVEPDGTVAHRQRFYWFHVPDDADDSGVRAWVMDTAGRLYAATRLGVQIFDRNGRVRAIMPLPAGAPVALGFGGRARSTLYVAAQDGAVYRRALMASGLPDEFTPIDLPAGNPG